jgi:hypothetical protein
VALIDESHKKHLKAASEPDVVLGRLEQGIKMRSGNARGGVRNHGKAFEPCIRVIEPTKSESMEENAIGDDAEDSQSYRNHRCRYR